MLDSLDLKALSADIRNNHKASRRIWFLWVLFIGTLTLFASLLVVTSSTTKTPGSTTCQSCGVLALILCLMPVILIVSSVTVYYLNLKRLNRRRELYEFDLTTLQLPTRISIWTSPMFLISLVWIGFWLVVAIAFKVNLLIISLGVIAIFPFLAYIGTWVYRPLKRADYHESDRRAELMKRWFRGDASILNVQGLALLYSGEAAKSEKIHREFLAQALNVKLFEPIALNNLACELVAQERYDEALFLLEIAINLHPSFPNAFETLAGWYLSQDLNPERALELTNFALQLKPMLLVLNKRATRSAFLAMRAWAEAKLGQVEKAKTSLWEALKTSEPEYVPGYAELHRIAGLTALAYSDKTAAREYFQKAAEIDPNGRIGKLAKAEQDKLTAEV